jgi:hypothetical protein
VQFEELIPRIALGFRADWISLSLDERCPLEYKLKMQTVVETPSYIRAAEAIFSETEREAIVAMVAADPECGELIQGTGGFRKVRVGRSGMGKRGGARVIYILRNEAFPVFLITIYPKNKKDNLTKEERNALAKRANEIFAKYKR